MFDVEESGNQIEAVLWFVVAAVLLVRSVWARGKLRRVILLLVIAFVAFGVSDLMESHSGAWWRPWWLAVLKVACAATFLYGFRQYYRLAWRERSSQSSANDDSSSPNI